MEIYFMGVGVKNSFPLSFSFYAFGNLNNKIKVKILKIESIIIFGADITTSF